MKIHKVNMKFHLLNLKIHMKFHLVNLKIHMMDIKFYLMSIFHKMNLKFHLMNLKFHGELADLESKLVGWEPKRSMKDLWAWELDRINGFSVKGLWKILAEVGREGNDGEKTVWLSLVPKKVNVFMWRLRRDRLPTRVVLDNLGVDLDSTLCPRCGDAREDLDHALFNCGVVKALWSRVGKWWNKRVDGFVSLAQFIQEDAGEVRRSHNKPWWAGAKWIFCICYGTIETDWSSETKKGALINHLLSGKGWLSSG
ncbi:hypothetical protein OSB04_un000576 [Centaurea solstitialis]|uniref:Reverse transcriptase zinc-binding domain-containing protein n=1 Tax=Centaurea solstitialis TaxID=347529 RepID=A0AA38SQ82_9ASTR|nr:hypothetical protein OSB04_un000576 [Centaurea solstitialis]